MRNLTIKAILMAAISLGVYAPPSMAGDSDITLPTEVIGSPDSWFKAPVVSAPSSRSITSSRKNSNAGRSNRLVFALYMTNFPLQIWSYNNAGKYYEDYYEKNYTNPAGENNKWLANGGFTRDEPLPLLNSYRPTSLRPKFQKENIALEVKRAADIGLDGFNVDIWTNASGDDVLTLHPELKNMLSVIPQVAPDFKVMLMPNFDRGGVVSAQLLAKSLNNAAKDPSVFKLADGRVVIRPWDGDTVSPSYWVQFKAEMEKLGHKVAVIPSFQGYWNYKASYGSAVDGMIQWGSRTTLSSTEKAKYKGLSFFGHTAFFDYFRPNSFVFQQSKGSERFTLDMESAIAQNSTVDMTEIATWNDYSESTHISPSVLVGTSRYELAAFYIAKFKDPLGRNPTILQDTLFYFYSPQIAVKDAGTNKYSGWNTNTTPPNTVNAVVLLKSPATLTATIGGNTTTHNLQAGLNNLYWPASAGNVVFNVSRVQNGNTVTVLNKTTDIPITAAQSVVNFMTVGGVVRAP